MAQRTASSLLLAAVCAALSAGTAWGNPQAIKDGYWMLHVPFDLEPFEPLSARSLGMGNAATATAEDTTAAIANPAALTTMQHIQFDTSLRYSSYDADYLDTYAALFNIGEGPDLGENRTFSDSLGSVSFLGVTVPIYERLAASLYYKDSSFQGEDAQQAGPSAALNILQENISQKNIDEYRKSTYGTAAAVKLHKQFSVGAAVNLETLNTDLQEHFIANGYSGSTLVSTNRYDNRIEGDDSDITFGIGAFYEEPSIGVSAGLAYRQGSSFSIGYNSSETACVFPGSCNSSSVKSAATFAVPDIWTAGVAWKPVADWLLSVQTDWVEYSALADGSTAGITLDEGIDDGVIYRFGAEKSFAVSHAMNCQLRAGFFHVPDHDGFQAIDSDRMYWTLGGGVSWMQLKANLGASFAEDNFDSVLSLSYSL